MANPSHTPWKKNLGGMCWPVVAELTNTEASSNSKTTAQCMTSASFE